MFEVTKYPKCITAMPSTTTVDWATNTYIHAESGKWCVGSSCYAQNGYNEISMNIDECSQTCQFLGNDVFPWFAMTTQQQEVTITAADRQVIDNLLTETTIYPESLYMKKCVSFSTFTLTSHTRLLG